MNALTLYGIPGKMTRRLAGVVLGAQGLAVFFGALVARALAAADDPQASTTPMVVGSLLALLCVVDAGLLRRPWGITLGWILQIATLATALVVPAMLIVGLLFGALWLTALIQGHAMDEHIIRVDAQWQAAQQTSGHSPSDGASVQEQSGQEPSADGPSGHESSAQEPTRRDTTARETSTDRPSGQDSSDPKAPAQDG